MSLQGYWADQSAPALREVPADLVAVLPLGATEQHGPHLPLSVDRDLVEAVITRALPALTPDQNVLVLPTLSVTKSGEHDSFAGTLSLTADTLLAVLRDIGASVARAGVQRLVFLNGHGGNTALLEVAARDLRMAHGMITAHASWFGFADWSAMDPEALKHDLHAGLFETAAMLVARPASVDMAQAEDFVPAMPGWEAAFAHIGLSGQPARPGWIIEDLHPQGACGNAAAATPELGAHLLDTAGAGFAAFLAEFARFDPGQGAP